LIMSDLQLIRGQTKNETKNKSCAYLGVFSVDEVTEIAANFDARSDNSEACFRNFARGKFHK
jgi:hypothetical protein